MIREDGNRWDTRAKIDLSERSRLGGWGWLH